MLTQTTNSNSYTLAQQLTYSVSLTASSNDVRVLSSAVTPVAGDTWRLDFADDSGATYSAEATVTGETTLKGLFDAFDSQFSKTGFTATVRGTGANAILVISRSASNNFDLSVVKDSTTGAAPKAVESIELSGTPDKDVDWTITTDRGTSTAFTYDVLDGQSLETVAKGLAAKITLDANYVAYASASTGGKWVVTVVNLTNTTLSLSFSKAFNYTNSGNTRAATVTGELKQFWSYAIALNSVGTGNELVLDGDFWKLKISGEDEVVGSRASNAGNSLNAILANLETKVKALSGGYTASISGTSLIVKRVDNNATVIESVKQVRQIVKQDGTRATALTAATGSFFTTASITLDGLVVKEQPWTIEIDGITYSYALPKEATKADMTVTNIAAELVKVVIAAAAAADAAATTAATTAGTTVAEENLFAYTVTANGARITITDKSGTNDPFALEVGRGGGVSKHIFDIDNANVSYGYESFKNSRFVTRSYVTYNFLGSPTVNYYTDIEYFYDYVFYTTSTMLELLDTDGVTVLADSALSTVLDEGSTSLLDPFLSYDFGGDGKAAEGLAANSSEKYFIRVSTYRDYAENSIFENSPVSEIFQDGQFDGVDSGLNYNLIVSAQNHVENENALDLADPNDPTTIRIISGDGEGKRATIGGYDAEQKVFILRNDSVEANDDATGVISNLAESDQFELLVGVPDGYRTNIIDDTYEVVLTGSPSTTESETITISVSPERTRTYNSDDAFNSDLYFGEQNEKQVQVATKQVVIESLQGNTFNDTWGLTLTPVSYSSSSGDTTRLTPLVVTADSLSELKTKIEAAVVAMNSTDKARYTGLTIIVDETAHTIEIKNGTHLYVDLVTGAATATGSLVEVELQGATEVGQAWTFEIGGIQLIYNSVNAANEPAVIDEWVGNVTAGFTFTATSNRNPRLTNIATAIQSLLETNAAFAQYEVNRYGRILEISSATNVAVTLTATGGANTLGASDVRVIRAKIDHQLEFTTSNWNVAQIVIVGALNDDFIDGGDALVFPVLEQRVNQVRGPLTINGGRGETAERFLTNPVLLLGETNQPVADGLLDSIGSVIVDDLEVGVITDLDATHINPNTGLRPGFDPRMNEFSYTIEFLDGNADGFELEVLSVSKDVLSIGNSDPFSIDLLQDGVAATDASLYVTVDSAFTYDSLQWSKSTTTFTGRTLATEVWIYTVGTEVYTVTYDEDVINTLGRGVLSLAKQINDNASSNHIAEVRVGLLGELNLIVTSKDSSDFVVDLTRSNGGNLGITQSGVLDVAIANAQPKIFTMAAVFMTATGGDATVWDLDVTEADGTVHQYQHTVTTGSDVAAVLTALLKDVDGALLPSLTGTEVTFRTNWPINLANGQPILPGAGDSYYYAPYNPNFSVDELEQVDTINVYNSDSPSNDVGTLTEDRLTGFGIGGDTVISGRLIAGGIHYKELESFNLFLGSGDDSLVVDSTHKGYTAIHLNDGDDRVAIRSTNGDIEVKGGEGDDSVRLASSGHVDAAGEYVLSADTGRLENIHGHVAFDGEAGTNTMSVDERSDSSTETGILTGSTFEGFGFNGISEVQTLTVSAINGSYRLRRGDVNIPWHLINNNSASRGIGAILYVDAKFGATQVQAALEDIFGDGNVAVEELENSDALTRNFQITYGGDLSGADISELVWADSGSRNLRSVGGLRPYVSVSTERNGGFGEITETHQILRLGAATGGDVRIDLLGKTTGLIPFYADAMAVFRAMNAVLNPDDGELVIPQTDNFRVVKDGSEIHLYFRGDYLGFELKPTALNTTNLIGIATLEDGAPTISTGDNHQVLRLDATGGTFTVRLLDQISTGISANPTVKELVDALNPILNPNNSDQALPHTDNFRVAKLGGDFHIYFQGEYSNLRLNPVDIDTSALIGDATLEIRGPSVSYYNLDQLDLYFGNGADLLNVRGTSTQTNVHMRGGNDEIYVSSQFDVSFTERAPNYLGALDTLLGALNIDGGSGTQVITVSDAGTSIGDPNVQILDRLPLFTSGLNLSGADLGADLFILGLAPSAITIRADELNGGSTGGFNIRTSSGNDTVYITGTADGSANSVDSLTNLSTGLGDDTVVVNLSSNDDGRLIINTQGDYTHRMILNAGIDLESLVSSLNEVEVYLDGVSIPVENIRVVPSQNAIDLNLDSSVGIVRPDSIVTAVVSKELNDRLEVEPRQRRYNIDHTLKTNEAVSLYSAGNQLEEGRDFFIIPGVDTFEVLFSLFFNLYINTDITYKIVESISESVPIAQVTLSDRDYVDAVRSGFGLTIHTGVGADLIKGSSYDDVIYAGSGDDLIFGNEGNDIIYGDDLGSLFSGDDVVFGGVGSITVMESGTSRTINGRVANQPGLSNDGLAFMVRAESDVNESAGNDTLYAGGGNNLVFGGAGNDVIVSTDGHDIILGDHGRVDYTDFRPSVVDSTTSNFVVGGDDTIASSGGINWIIAGTGTDNVTTGSGDDVVLGDLGIIEFEYDILTDSFLIESLISTDVASGANDVLLLGAGYNLAIAGYGLDRIETSGFGSYTMLTGGTLRFSAGSLLSAMQYKPLNDPYYPGSSLGNVINLDGILLERVAVVLNLQIGTEEEDGV